MTSRTLVTIATLCAGLSLAAASAARAGEADASFEHPLSTAWLSGGPALPNPSEAPACRADDPNVRSASARTAARIAQVRAALAAEAARAPEGPGEVMVLNNRGYNYGSGATVDPTLIEFEAKRLAR